MRFWDASAVVPLCVEEEHTSALRKLLAADAAPVVWWGTAVECASALARLRRDGGLTEVQEDQARRVLGVLAEAWSEIQPVEEVRQTALRVLRLHPLRSADALQLAAALVWARGRPQGRHLVCLDLRLAQAARREGFGVLPAVA